MPRKVRRPAGAHEGIGNLYRDGELYLSAGYYFTVLQEIDDGLRGLASYENGTLYLPEGVSLWDNERLTLEFDEKTARAVGEERIEICVRAPFGPRSIVRWIKTG